jgi:GDP-D-mannose 3',5'-epimerase
VRSTQSWKGREVLITGGAGFIGSNLVSRLVEEGARIRVIDNLERGRPEYLTPYLSAVDFITADLRDYKTCLDACNDVEVVFHLASKVGGILYYIQQAGEVFRANTKIDHNMWNAAQQRRVPYYFYASSAHIYPGELQTAPDSPLISENQSVPANPQLSYGWAKFFGEKLILFDMEQGVQTRAAIGRIIGAYGPNQSVDLATGSVIPVFCRRAIEYQNGRQFIVLGTGRETRSFHYVTDTIEAMLRAVQKLEAERLIGPFNLGSEERISIGDLAREVIAISGKKIDIAWDTSKPTAIWGQALSCALASRLLDGWKPAVGLRDGLKTCYQHISSRLIDAKSQIADVPIA